MAGYIGQDVAEHFSEFQKQDLTGATGGTLTLSSSVNNANDIELYINHVRQEPTTSYSASGTTITLNGYTVAASDDIYVMYKKAIITHAPSSGSVGAGQISNGAVTGDKLSANLDLQNVTIKGGSNTAMTIDSSGRPAFPNRVAFEAWYTGANLTINAGSNAGLVYNNVEQQGGTNYATGTGKFTVPITGFYCFAIKNNFYNIADGNIMYHGLMQNGTGFSSDEPTFGEYMTSSHSTLDFTLSSTIIRKYTANDTLQPFVRVGDNGNGTGRTNAEALNYHTFAGFLIG